MGKVPVDAVETSLEILSVLEDHAPLGITEVASRTETPKATVYYHLQTLADRGYVTQREDGYDLGLRVLELGGRVRDGRQLTSVVEPNLQRLGTETNEIAVFAVEEHGSAVLLHVERPTSLTTPVDVSVGMHLPVHGSAVGKALLAAMPEDRRDAILADHDFETYTADTVASETELRNRLDTVRSEGHAFDRGEFDSEVHSVAAPVVDENEFVLGAVGIVGPSSRLYSDRFAHELPHLVERFAERIEYELRS